MKTIKLTSLITTVAASAVLAACASTNTQRSTGETVDDAMITTRVKAELVQNDNTKARQIEVETYRGVVQLNGFVDSQNERSTAERVARNVEGVKEVHNNLKLKDSMGKDDNRSAGTTIDDATLTARVKAALVDDPATAARRINVTTYDAVVQLSGFVNSDDEKRAAGKVAAGIDGVKQVRNDLEVKPASKE